MVQSPPLDGGAAYSVLAAFRHRAEQPVQAPVQAVQNPCQLALVGIALLARLLQLVGQVQRGQHCQPVQRDHAVAAADLAHARIQHAGGGPEAVALVRSYTDGVVAIEDAYFDRLGAHVCCSSDRSRAIIASTRERACSFFSSSCARSPISCSCCWRRLRFSSARRWQRSASASIRAARARRRALASVAGSMTATIGSARRAGQAAWPAPGPRAVKRPGQPAGGRAQTARWYTCPPLPDPAWTCRNCPPPKRSPPPAASSAWPRRPRNYTAPCAAGWPAAVPTCRTGPPG